MLNTRIKKIREHWNLTQEEFGKRIGSARNTIANYENGNRNPSNSVIKSICREFGINEEWLRTGNGDWKAKKARNQEILDYANEVMDLPNDNIQKRLIEALIKLDSNDWKAIEKIAEKLLKEG